jgi:ascorbate-specific PTS system EIIC-type component UlaA
MKTFVILLVLGVLLIGLGEFYFASGRSADERIGGILPTFIGMILLAVGAVIALVWLVRRVRHRQPSP